jgi:hypothetical protein
MAHGWQKGRDGNRFKRRGLIAGLVHPHAIDDALPGRWPRHELPYGGSCLRHVSVCSRPAPRLLGGSNAKQTGAGHCAAVSSTQSVCVLWHTCRFERAREPFPPGSGYCWHRRSALSPHSGSLRGAKRMPARGSERKISWSGWVKKRVLIASLAISSITTSSCLTRESMLL